MSAFSLMKLECLVQVAMRDEKQLTAMIVPFYLGEQPDAEGRMIQEIWAWDFEDLECQHDYIQWLFPLPERSSFNPDAPVVDEEVIQAFHANVRLRHNLLHSFTLMLKFYGLQGDSDNEGQFVITKSEDYPVRKKEWLCPLDHNYLRITRILKCLMLLRLESYAQSFYRCLKQIYREESSHIGGETFQYWTNAIKGGTGDTWTTAFRGRT
jgi:hypothetical protein